MKASLQLVKTGETNVKPYGAQRTSLQIISSSKLNLESKILKITVRNQSVGLIDEDRIDRAGPTGKRKLYVNRDTSAGKKK